MNLELPDVIDDVHVALQSHARLRLARNLTILTVSILTAVLLAATGIFEDAVVRLGTSGAWFSVVAGFAFVSVFTVAPASVAIFQLGAHGSPLVVAFLAAFGAVVADFLIFRFIKTSLLEDFKIIFQRDPLVKISELAKQQRYHWFFVFVGAAIVASPLPDEIGLTLLGVSKLETRLFLPAVFLLDFTGILILVLTGSQLG